MCAYVAETVTGSTKVRWQDNEIDYTPPWKRMTMREAIKATAEIDYMEYPDAPSLEAAIRAHGD